MAWLRTVFQHLPTRWQQTLLRRYLVHEIRQGRRLAEGEIFYLPNLIQAGDVVWDIGANAGEYTFQLSRLVGPEGHVHAFEPLAYNFGTLVSTIRRASLRNVAAHRIALSDYCGSAYMCMPTPLDHSLATFADQGEKVAVDTIDRLIAGGLARPSFIKCDVEGNAPQVVSGALALIYEHRPLWLMEVWSDEEIARMESLGYDCYRYPARGGTLQQVHQRKGTTSTYFFLPRTVNHC